MAPTKKSTMVSIEEVHKAWDKHGVDMIVIEKNSRSAKSGHTSYHTTFLKLANGEQKPLKLYFPATKIFGCKEPEVRGDKPPTYAINIENTTNNGSQLGLAMKLIDEAWCHQVKQLKKDNVFDEDDKIHEITTKKLKKGPTPSDYVPMCRITFRSKSKDDKTLKGTVRVLYEDKNGQMSTRMTASNGAPFTTDNIHQDVRGGSVAFGCINLSETTKSSFGISNSKSNEFITVKGPSGYILDIKTETDADDLAELAGVTVEPAVNDVDPDDDDDVTVVNEFNDDNESPFGE